jgi:hypothetical protein
MIVAGDHPMEGTTMPTSANVHAREADRFEITLWEPSDDRAPYVTIAFEGTVIYLPVNVGYEHPAVHALASLLATVVGEPVNTAYGHRLASPVNSEDDPTNPNYGSVAQRTIRPRELVNNTRHGVITGLD